MHLLMSCISRKGFSSAVILSDGIIKAYKTVRIRDEAIKASSYKSMIYAFDIGLKLLRVFLDEHEEVESVVFEMNNSNFIGWLHQGFSHDTYRDEFSVMLESLNDLPIRYSINFVDKPRATTFADVKFLKKEKLSGLD